MLPALAKIRRHSTHGCAQAAGDQLIVMGGRAVQGEEAQEL